jgi:hypothetical protein
MWLLIREDGIMRPEDLPAFIRQLGAEFGSHDRVASTRTKMRELKQMICEFSQYDAEFKVVAADLDWNLSALRNARGMGLSEEMSDVFTHNDMPEDLHTFVTVC